MNEAIIKKVSLIVSLLGTLLLLGIAEVQKPPKFLINEISEEMLDQKVMIQGGVSSFKNTGTIAIFTVEDATGKIKVIAFAQDLKENLTEKQNVIVEGAVKEYRGSLEIESSTVII